MPPRPGSIALGALLLTACDRMIPTAPVEGNSTEVTRGCAETGPLLAQMKAAEPSFRYDQRGNATISRSLWEMLPAGGQEGLVKAIAYEAVCAADRPTEQHVTIRSSETNEVLTEQTVTDFVR